MSGSTRSCDVVVVGAGLAGLTAATRLAGAGLDVRVVEACSTLGGRVHGERTVSGVVLDTGAEFVGRPHRRLRRLLAELGLHTVPSGLDRAPLLWRLPDRPRVSRLPPIPPFEVARLARGWWRLARRTGALDPDRPWNGPAAAELDAHSLADWLANQGVTRRGLDVTEALIGGFATTSTRALSAAHPATWIAAAGGPIAALHSGADRVVAGGAHQIPRRLADRLSHLPVLNTPVTAVREHAGGVEVRAAEDAWRAGAVVVAVPLPALRRLEIDPPPPEPFTTAARTLTYGSAIKVSARTAVPPPVAHRTVLGGRPLAIAWRHARTLAGISTADTVAAPDLAADLANAFGLDRDALTDVTVTDWAQTTVGGSYLTYAPGQLTRHAAPLRTGSSPRVRFAGADFSSWQNSMEGAVQSGQAVADSLLAHPPTR